MDCFSIAVLQLKNELLRKTYQLYHFFVVILQLETMTLHVFNPEHDLALAANLSNFTSPHAGRQLRADIGFLPAIWADGDDVVLVEDVEAAQRDFAKVMHRSFDRFVDKRQLARLDITHVEPWGWDLALRSFLIRYGVRNVLTEEEIGVIRDLSHRNHAIDLLRALDFEGTTGRSWLADGMAAVRQALQDCRRIVVKAPWSSSGRGIRFIEANHEDVPHDTCCAALTGTVPMISQQRWIENVIERQGSVVIETYCHKVKDFGMEFESDGEGHVRYLGLSLFHTQNAAYIGNILASEEEKQEKISRYLSMNLLEKVQEKICVFLGELYRGKYAGPFGVDMMVVRGDDQQHFLLNPCVEINLRRTMGHVALALSKQMPSDLVMRVEYSDNTYKLKIKQI